MQSIVDIGENFVSSVKNYEISEQLDAAIEDHKSGRLNEAARSYQRVLWADENNIIALNNLSLTLNDHEALKLLTKAIEIQPNYKDALINTVVRYINLEDYQNARAIADRAKKLHPEDEIVNQLIKSLGPEKFEMTIKKCPNNFIDFSVIIPTHRRPLLLARALSSIKQQTNAVNCEIIVVSDYEDEKTDAVCKEWLKPTDTYLRRSGSPGPSASRNLGLKIAKGRVILFLDDDDAWHINLLADLNKCEHLKNGFPVYFNSTIVKESRTPEGPILLEEVFLDSKNRLDENIFVKNQIHMSSLAIPIYYLKGIEFDIHMRAYEDWDFILSIFERGLPKHAPILGSKIYEVEDETSDRRGSIQEANDFNAVIDYIYVYRRHSVDVNLQIKRSELLRSAGLNIEAKFL